MMEKSALQFMLLLSAFGIFLIATCEAKCSGHSFDYFVFSQVWPQSQCEQIQHMHKTCIMNKNITAWTIHGIWPTQFGQECPNFCNHSDKFQPQQIQKLEPNLREHWPNLIANEKYYDFWNHEWEKHGTCAKSLEAMNSQYKYFNMGLMLNKIYNLTSVFEQNKIKPGNTYKLADIEYALKSLGSPVIRCAYIEDKEQIAQISMCLDKDFKVLNCSHLPSFTKHKSLTYVEPCSERHQDTVYYPPIQYTERTAKVYNPTVLVN